MERGRRADEPSARIGVQGLPLDAEDGHSLAGGDPVGDVIDVLGTLIHESIMADMKTLSTLINVSGGDDERTNRGWSAHSFEWTRGRRRRDDEAFRCGR